MAEVWNPFCPLMDSIRGAEGVGPGLAARKNWKEFQQEYNQVIQEWKTFTDRALSNIGWMSLSKAVRAKDIP